MAIALSVVLLRDPVPLALEGIERELRTRYPEMRIALDGHDEMTATFNIDAASVTLGVMPAPYPWSDLQGPCATSLLWKGAAEDIKPHRAHIIVTLSSDLSLVEQAILLTKATTAVLAASNSALGVYWGTAALIVPRRIFVEFTEEVLPLGPPLDIWVDFRVGKQTATTSGGFTTGMKALGHMEFEAEGSPEKPSELRERFQDLARHLLQNDAKIRDGDTIGQDAEERIRVVYARSAFGQEGKVMRLQYESNSGKSWWRVW